MPISTVELTTALGRWDEGTGPLYAKLARALARLFEGGRVDAGSALPAERQLALALSVSRNTVTAAYSQLRHDGWVHSRQGSATIVTGARHSPVAAFKTSGLFAHLMRAHPDVIDMTIAVPEAAPVVADVVAEPGRFVPDPRALVEGHGYLPAGSEELRCSLASVLTGNGLPTEPDELIVTSGAQQAISLAFQAIVRSGDRVVVEEVTYPGALDIATARGGDLRPVGLSEHGVDLAAFDRELIDHHPRLAYLVATFHNPTGALLDQTGRRHVARTVTETQVVTIDDLTVAELDYRDPAPPPLAAIAPDAPIISVGSLSKVFWGGLRIGWLRARPAVIDHLLGFKTSADLGSSAIAQGLAVAMLTRYDETRAWRKNELARSYETLANSIVERLPDWSWQFPAGGPHVWLRMPPGGDATAFAHSALKRGLALVPGALLAAHDDLATDRIRLPLYPEADLLASVVEIMAETWRGERMARAG